MRDDQAVDDTGLVTDEEGFAGPPARPQPRPRGENGALRRNGGNGNGNGSEAEDAQAENARLRAENARLRVVAATASLEARLEAGRDEPMTKGDLLDVLDYVRNGAAAHQETVYDGVAGRVMQFQREELGIDGDEDENGATTKGKGKAKGKGPEELPVERVTKINHAKVYQGETEPDIVTYIDGETGEDGTRKGRKKGAAYGFIVERIED
jgi:hypothetical protein